MGGRGGENVHKSYDQPDKWKWLEEVDNDRLQGYIDRSEHLGNRPDPQGRSIHDVAYHARNELKRRNS